MLKKSLGYLPTATDDASQVAAGICRVFSLHASQAPLAGLLQLHPMTAQCQLENLMTVLIQPKHSTP